MYSPEKLAQILSHFSIARNSYEFQPKDDGLINDTFLVTANGTPEFILQRINCDVFDDPKVLMGNINRALIYLQGDGYAQLNLIRTTLDKYYSVNEGAFWRLMEYIPGSTTHNTTNNPVISHEAGKIIGTFHNLLENARISEFSDVIPDFHNLENRKNTFYEVAALANPKRLGIAGEAISRSIELFQALKGLDRLRLPSRICHNDTKLNNILFSQSSGRALCLIDLDTLMKGYFYYDFGDAVRTIVNTAPEDGQDHTKITFERGLFEAFVDGLAASQLNLTDGELDSLPLGAVHMPFIHGLRALTDYLNEDRYYKVMYETQNLDRCLSLFDFANKALGETAYMAKILTKKFKSRSV